MTQPTQAQIEAAAKAAWERYKGFPWPGNQELWEDAIKAGFVAAARVGEPTTEELVKRLDDMEVRERNATIERCAQVVRDHLKDAGYELRDLEIIEAILKLKDAP